MYLGLVFFTDSLHIHRGTDLVTPAFFFLLFALFPNSGNFKLSVLDCTDDSLEKYRLTQHTEAIRRLLNHRQKNVTLKYIF
jgi:hypothetical protein